MGNVNAMKVGLYVYGLAALFLGAVGLVFADFADVWQPVPKEVPLRAILAYSVGAALVAGGAGVWLARTRRYAALALTALFGLDVVLLHGAHILAQPLVLVSWTGAAEQLAVAMGALVIWAATFDPKNATAVKAARLAFGVCAIGFGAAHFEYMQPTADWVPKYFPNPAFWAALTGAAHILAGIALLADLKAKLAARLSTAMYAVFGLLVHAPGLLAHPHDHFWWCANAVNLTLVGAAWALSDEL